MHFFWQLGRTQFSDWWRWIPYIQKCLRCWETQISKSIGALVFYSSFMPCKELKFEFLARTGRVKVLSEFLRSLMLSMEKMGYLKERASSSKEVDEMLICWLGLSSDRALSWDDLILYELDISYGYRYVWFAWINQSLFDGSSGVKLFLCSIHSLSVDKTAFGLHSGSLSQKPEPSLVGRLWKYRKYEPVGQPISSSLSSTSPAATVQDS